MTWLTSCSSCPLLKLAIPPAATAEPPFRATPHSGNSRPAPTVPSNPVARRGTPPGQPVWHGGDLGSCC